MAEKKGAETSSALWLMFVFLLMTASLVQIGLAMWSTGPDLDHTVRNLHLLSGVVGVTAVMISCWARMRQKKGK